MRLEALSSSREYDWPGNVRELEPRATDAVGSCQVARA
jgi:DNA-binding NtrC family response regulator